MCDINIHRSGQHTLACQTNIKIFLREMSFATNWFRTGKVHINLYNFFFFFFFFGGPECVGHSFAYVAHL
jgi:hypothetical protein